MLKDVAAVFKDMPNGAEKSTLAVQLFGRSGLDMIPMLNKGADGIADLEAKTAAYGLTLTKTDQDASGEVPRLPTRPVSRHGGRQDVVR